MVTTTKNSIQTLFESTNTNLSSKITSELYKSYNSNTASKSETNTSKHFNEVLSSKTNFKDEDTQKVDDFNNNETSIEDNDTINETNEVDNTVNEDTNEVKEKLEELEEDSKSSSKEEINDILTELMNLLNQLGVNGDDIKLNEGVNTDISQTTIEGINGDTTSSSTMEKLMQLLQTDSAKDGLDTDSLKVIEKLLSNLSANIADDNTESTKDIRSGIKDLTSQISNMLDNKQNQSGKVLTLEDMLNKNYSQDNKDSQNEGEGNNATTSKDTKGVSKDDKFLSSLLDDNTDSATNKINLFAARTQTIQNQGVNTTNGLTINKATLTDDLIKDVKYMSNNGIKELTVKINPGNLGEITIKLVEEDGVMKANLKANSKETAALLAQNLADIKNQLSGQNIKISDVNIELYQGDTTFFSGEGLDSQLSKEEQKNSNSSSGKNGETSADGGLIENIQTVDNSNVNFLA